MLATNENVMNTLRQVKAFRVQLFAVDLESGYRHLLSESVEFNLSDANTLKSDLLTATTNTIVEIARVTCII